KQRQRTKPQIISTPDGDRTVITAERIGYRQCLTPVRAFYLDLSQWAIRSETAAADQAPDHQHAGRGQDRHHRRADRLPPVPDPGPGLLPGPVPVGDQIGNSGSGPSPRSSARRTGTGPSSPPSGSATASA